MPLRLLRSGVPIGRAAATLGTTPRMLRYREALGLLPSRVRPAAHRRYSPADLAAAGFAIDCEQRYGVAPGALAFAIRVLAEPGVQADIRRLAELAGALPAGNAAQLAALGFEQEKARRLLDLAG